MTTQQEKWEKIEVKLIEKYLPKLRKLLNNDNLILKPVPIKINKHKGNTRVAGRWNGTEIELCKNHLDGLTRETLLHELLHVFISQNKLWECDKKSELFNKLVLNLNTKKINIGSCHGAYKWQYKCCCGWWLKTNEKYIRGTLCGKCGKLIEKPKRYLTKSLKGFMKEENGRD
jgi:hypothetical protein